MRICTGISVFRCASVIGMCANKQQHYYFDFQFVLISIHIRQKLQLIWTEWMNQIHGEKECTRSKFHTDTNPR